MWQDRGKLMRMGMLAQSGWTVNKTIKTVKHRIGFFGDVPAAVLTRPKAFERKSSKANELGSLDQWKQFGTLRLHNMWVETAKWVCLLTISMLNFVRHLVECGTPRLIKYSALLTIVLICDHIVIFHIVNVGRVKLLSMVLCVLCFKVRSFVWQ